jgi:hypothetical protein
VSRSIPYRRGPRSALALAALLFAPATVSTIDGAELHPETLRAWEQYIELTEQRIASELASADKFLAREFLENPDRLATDRVFIERLQTRSVEGQTLPIPKGMVHHWLGSIVIPNVELSDVLDWVQDSANFEKHVKEVEGARLLYHEGDDYRFYLRIRAKRIKTVYYNTEHAIHYEYHGPGRTSSKTEATRIVEIDEAGTANEREKPEGQDSGYLWRWNSYWRFQQVDDGVIVECETVSLSRSVPKVIWWFVKPFISSVPKEALESTLLSLREGVTAGR